MNLHWQVIITQSPTFALLFILGVVYSFNLPVQSLSCVWLFVTPWIVACHASLSITNSQRLHKLISIESVMPSNHLILCHPLFLLPSVFPSISSVQFSHSVMFDSLWPYEPQHDRPPCLSPTLESTQTHVHWVSDAIQPCHPLSSSSPALNLSQHQGLFKWVCSSHQVAKVLKLQLQHQSFQWTLRTDLL